MRWSTPGEARKFAVLAAARGWLDAADVWDAATAYANGQGRDDPRDLFPLAEAQLESLRDGTGIFVSLGFTETTPPPGEAERLLASHEETREEDAPTGFHTAPTARPPRADSEQSGESSPSYTPNAERGREGSRPHTPEREGQSQASRPPSQEAERQGEGLQPNSQERERRSESSRPNSPNAERGREGSRSYSSEREGQGQALRPPSQEAERRGQDSRPSSQAREGRGESSRPNSQEAERRGEALRPFSPNPEGQGQRAHPPSQEREGQGQRARSYTPDAEGQGQRARPSSQAREGRGEGSRPYSQEAERGREGSRPNSQEAERQGEGLRPFSSDAQRRGEGPGRSPLEELRRAPTLPPEAIHARHPAPDHRPDSFNSQAAFWGPDENPSLSPSLSARRAADSLTPQDLRAARKTPTSLGAVPEASEDEAVPLSRLSTPMIGSSRVAPKERPQARYIFGKELGRGGVGRVVSAYDRRSGRTVAIKVLHERNEDPSTLSRFLTEARVASQLEHPSIIPVYDLGELEDGSPYYSMRVVKQTSLREVLKNSRLRAGWTLPRLCGVFVQVSRGLAYAHARGVVHRDIKPSNILLGDYGEVYVADWGICKLIQGGEIGATLADLQQPGRTLLGTVLGTPGYLSPEQARGDVEDLDGRADLFSLGVALYQVITGQRPFVGESAEESIAATLFQEAVAPRDLVESCPLGLSVLCLRLLSKDREGRPATAAEVADELESFVEGDKERDRRRSTARHLSEQGGELAERYEMLCREKDALREQSAALLSGVEPWDVIEKKRPGWAVEEQARATEGIAAQVLAESVERYSQALGYDPESREAKRGLAALYLGRARAAEQARDEPGRIFHEAMVREYDEGHFSALLSSEARLSVRCHPGGAKVFCARYEEQDRRWLPVQERFLGEAPLRELRVTAGRYLLTLRRSGFREVRYPVWARRGEHIQIAVNFYTESEIGGEFVYIPGGGFAFGGDPEADNALPAETLEVGDFAIQRFPVSLGEYLQFVNELWLADPRQAERRLPRGEGVDGLYVEQDESGYWRPRYGALIRAEGRRFCDAGEVERLPVLAIDWFDAMSYARWRSVRDGVVYRLPTEAEYEKAARGTDGRTYPWGDRFDATFCKMRESRPGLGQPEPMGAFLLDESPYGVRDLAGSARCWTLDLHGDPTPAEVLEGGRGGEDPRVRGVRGGSWGTTEARCRAASRHGRFASLRTLFIGMRLVKALPPQPWESEQTRKLQRP